MKLLADEGVDAAIVTQLRNDGCDILWVAELDPGIADETVLERACREARMLVTADKDFGELVFRRKQVTDGVILIRLAGIPSAAKASIVANAIRSHGESLRRAFTVIGQGALRIRKSPD